jgi:type I restriction enzyme S subunit
MSVTPDTAAPTGRNKPAQGKERSDATLGHASQNTSSPEGAMQGGSSSRLVPLDKVARHHSGNSKLIKGKLHDAPADNLFPAFSATGQDVWRDAFDREGDAIIISAVGARCGKCFLARGRWSAIANTHVVWPDPEMADIKFLWYLLNDEQFWIRSGSAQPFVAVRKTFEKEIFVPPLPEQRRIVAEIEKQFTRLEAGVAALRRVQANLKRYRAAVLKAACEGRLVPTEASLARSPRSTKNGPPAYETGEALLARILTERRQNWQGRGKYKEPAAPEQMADVELPEGWVWTGFEQIADGTKNAIKAGPFGSSLKKSFYTPSGFKIYGQEQVIKGDAYFGDYFISRQLFEQLQSCEVKPGDILISLVGTTGKVLILPDDCAPGIINPRLLKLSLNRSGVNAKFIKVLLESATTRAFFKLAAHGGTMEILNLGILKTLPIALPPLAEQTRIVAEVERRLSVVEELESVVTANLQRATRLRQSILQKAFTGELT